MIADLRSQLQSTLGSTYSIERELGGGGMSRVFVATRRALGRDVVVKVLSPELAAGLERRAVRARDPARRAAPAGEHRSRPLAGERTALPYYTMPFVRRRVAARAARDAERLPSREAVSILRDVARALAYAHAQGVVHRDIKPENVLLSGGAAVVTDFGIAKAISASRTTRRTAATTGSRTPAHRSARPRTWRRSRRSAIRPPITAPTSMRGASLHGSCSAARIRSRERTTMQALIAAHVTEAPPSLAAKARTCRSHSRDS